MRDFSGGRLDKGALRADDRPEYKTGCRAISNWLIESTGSAVGRPGRRLLAQTGAARVEYARVGSNEFAIAFGTNSIIIYDLASATIVTSVTSPTYLWTNSTVGLIYLAVVPNQIVICFPGMRPQLAIRASTTGVWTFTQFTFRTITNQSQQPFYRAGNLGAVISYSAVSGTVNLTMDQSYFTAAMVGNILSILGQQVTINTVTSPTAATATVADRLPDYVTFHVNDTTPFNAGQVAGLSDGSIKIEVRSVSTPTGGGDVSGVLTSAVVYNHTYSAANDILVSPLGSSKLSAAPTITSAGQTVEWQEQFMGDILGWPSGCSFDRSRLIMFDFPQRPEAILWSAIGEYDVFWVDQAAATLQPDAGADATSAILEFIPGNPRVLHVEGWGDEFVFTDQGIYLIPITAAGNPLQPGSVEFRQFSNDGVSSIVPVKTQDAIIYINAGLKRASVVIRTGSYTNPYTTDGAADIYNDLFTGPVAMCVAQGDGQIPDRLIYVVNADGSVLHGKFSSDKKFVGWQPWFSTNKPSWVFCSGPNVYYSVALAGSYWLEQEDLSIYLDEAVMPNALPPSLPAPPAGDGPVIFMAGSTATLMDGALDKGDRQIDINGNIVALSTDDALTSATLIVGYSFSSMITPFVAAPAPGESEGQRQHRRKISRAMSRTYGACGYSLGSREVSPYQQGEDQSVAAPMRLTSTQTRPIGRSFDPQCSLVKSRPGFLRVLEISTEATI